MNVISRGMRNAFRNSIRTFSIVVILSLSIGLTLIMLIARQGVQTKINSVKASIGAAIIISPAGARGFQGGGEPLTTAEVDKVRSLPHVAAVTETLQTRFTSADTNLVSAIEAGTLGRRFNGSNNPRNTNFSPPVIATGATVLDSSALAGGGTYALTSGKNFDPMVDANVAIVGTALAAKNNLQTGSTFTVYGGPVTVAGIYDAGNKFSNNSLIMPLATVQRLSSRPGELSSAQVQVDAIQNTDSTVTAIQNTLGATIADVTSQQSKAAAALGPLQNILTITLYSLIGSLTAGAAIILLTMMMIVRERRREIGVLKAIGSSNVGIVSQFVTEAITFTLLAAVVGLGIGIAAAGAVTKVLVTTSSSSDISTTRGFAHGLGHGVYNGLQNIHTAAGWDILLYGLLAAITIAIVGSAIPSLLIAKIRPAEVMRFE